MQWEEKNELGANIIKLGLSVGALACPLVALADPAMDLTLFILKSTGIIDEKIDSKLNNQFKECIKQTLMHIKKMVSTDTQKKLIHFASSQLEYKISQVGQKALSTDELNDLLVDSFNSQQANDELYIQKNDIQTLCGLFINCFTIELLKHNELAHYYNIKNIDSIKTSIQSLMIRIDKFESQLTEYEDRILKLERGHRKTNLDYDVYLSCLIRLKASGLSNEQAETTISQDIINKCLDWIIPEYGKFTILKGDYGCGKTYCAEILYLQLLDAYKKNGSEFFPLWINMSDFKNLENKISDLLGLGDIREVFIISDGLDEQSYTEADSIIKYANYMTIKYPNIKILLTSRSINIVDSLAMHLDSISIVNTKLLSDEETCKLINFISNKDVIGPISFFHMDKETVEILKRPFFAILLAKNENVQKTIVSHKSSKLKSILLNDFTNNIFDQKETLKSDFLNLSINCIDNDFANIKNLHLKSNFNDILRTGLIVHDQHNDTVKFALPLIAQWLASEALFLKLTSVESINENITTLYKWKYPLTLFIYRYRQQQLDEVFHPIIKKHPAIMGEIINKGIDNQENGHISKEASKDVFLTQLIDVFRIGLKETAPVVFPANFTINIRNSENANSIEYIDETALRIFAVKTNHENWYYYAAYKVLCQQIGDFLKKPPLLQETAMFNETVWEISCKAINNGSLRNKPVLIDEILKKIMARM